MTEEDTTRAPARAEEPVDRDDSDEPTDPANDLTKNLPEPEVDPDPEQAWKALSLVNDWIKHADAKSGITLAATGAAGILLYNLVKDATHPDCVLTRWVWVTVIVLVITGVSGVTAILPRLNIKQRVRHPIKSWKEEQDLSSLLFYRSVAKKYKGQSPEFVEVFRTLTTDKVRLTAQIAQQVHANATVAHRKYVWANVAVRLLGLAYALLAIVAYLVGTR